MGIPIRIDFKNMDHSDAVEAEIVKRCEKFERFAPDMLRCKVTVEAPHRHHHQGNTYRISIDLHLPGAEILVNRDSGRNQSHEDVYVTIRDAVNAASRQLQEHVRKTRGKVKAHEAPLHGEVSELRSDEDCGRIRSSDGRLIYFHRNSLIDARLEDLALGTEVRFDEELGDEGPQATSVRLIGKHHIVP